MYRGSCIAVVVPAYNEEDLIRDTLHGIPEYVDRVYVVNDGSTDGTEECIKGIASRDDRFVLINHGTNMGVGAAIVTGYSRSIVDDMDITAVMAGDNQMDPLELHKLLDPLIDGEADYAKGNRLTSRATAKGMSDWRYFGNTVLTFLTRFTSGNRSINDPQNGYTAVSNRVFKKMDPRSIFTWYGYCNDMLVKLSTYGYIIKDVDIPARYGKEKSKISYPIYILRISRLLLHELVWRINYQHLRQSTRRADAVMTIGGVVSASGLAIAAFGPILPFVSDTSASAGSMLVLAFVGSVIAYMGYIVKRGGTLMTGFRKV